MANTDAPQGLRPVMHMSGAPYNGSANAYFATDSTAIFLGDAVLLTGESLVPGHAVFSTLPEGAEGGSLPIVTRATAGQANRISGVVVGVQATTHLSTPYRAASEGRILWVCDDPDVLFEIQADGTVGDEAVGGAYQLIDTHSGSTTTGRSGTEMSSTTATGGTGAQLVVHRAVPRTGNDITAANSQWLVRINQHTSRTSAAVVGDVE